MTYDGGLVRLRAMEPSDAEAQHRWFNDPAVTRYLGIRYPVSAAAVAGRLDGAGAMTFANPRFSIERRDTGALVGYAALRDVTPESRHAELDVVIGDTSAWGQGLGGDATSTVCRFAFDRMGLHRLQAWVFTDHTAALRIAERHGFVAEGTARHKVYRHGQWHDCVLLGRLA